MRTPPADGVPDLSRPDRRLLKAGEPIFKVRMRAGTGKDAGVEERSA